MTRPRRVLAGTTYLLTRRTSQRSYFFRPDETREMQRIFVYCLAVAAKEHGLDVHAATLMSTHHHLVVTDHRGVLPQFLASFHTWLARATQCHRGLRGEIFDGAQPSTVALLTPEAIVDKIAYTLANPVAAGAVRYARDWPGVVTRVDEIGGVLPTRVARPDVYFADDERWDAEARLVYTMPEALIAPFGGVERAREAIVTRVDDKEREARAKAAREGLSFLGRDRAMRRPIRWRATSWEEFGSRNPTFAAAGNVGVARAAVVALRTFQAAYREALDRWRSTVRNAVFPHGTWLMRVLHHSVCAPAPG